MKLVIDIEPRYCKDMESDVKGLYYEAINRITEAVRNGKPYEENSQGDLISRDALKNAISEATYNFEQIPIRVDKVQEIIDNTPIVTDRTEEVLSLQNTIAKLVEGIAETGRQQGEWIIVKDERYGDHVKCPFCGKELAGTDLNFCCKCGAKLIGSEKMNGDAE